MALPLLPLRTSSTDVALLGVTRRSGQPEAEEDTSITRRRVDKRGPTVSTDGAARLLSMASDLRVAGLVARRWKQSVYDRMTFKQDMYSRELNNLQSEINDAQAKVAGFVRQARSGEDALADDQSSNWDVAEKVSGRWRRRSVDGGSLWCSKQPPWKG